MLRRRDWLCSIGLLLLSIAIYWEAPSHSRLREDEQVIWSNPAVSGEDARGALLGRFYDTRVESRPVVRPLSAVVLRGAHSVFTFDRALYQWAAMVLHGVNAILLFCWVRRRTGSFASSLVMAVLFAVHPLATGAVLSLAGTSLLLALGLGLLALLLTPAASMGGRAWAPSIVAAGLATLAHEGGLVFLPLLLLQAWTTGPPGGASASRSRVPAAAWIGIVITLGAQVAWRLAADAALTPALHLARSVSVTSGLTWIETATRGLAAIPVALGLVVAPLRLQYLYDGLLVLQGTPFTSLMVAGGAILALGAIWLLRSLAAGRAEHARWLAFALFPLVAAAGIVVPTGDVLQERMLYLALPGLLAIPVLILPELLGGRLGLERSGSGSLRAARFRATALLAVGVIASLFAVRTVFRAQDFRNRETLVKSQIESDPRSAQARFELGVLYLERGVSAAAQQEFERAVAIRPNLWEAWVNLGTGYYRNDDLGLAMRSYEQAWPGVKDNPALHTVRARLLFNRALVLTKQNRNAEATVNLEEALKVFPDHLRANAVVGYIYANSDEHLDKAIFHLSRAIELEPDPEGRKRLQSKLSDLEKRKRRKVAFEEHGDMNRIYEEEDAPGDSISLDE